VDEGFFAKLWGKGL